MLFILKQDMTSSRNWPLMADSVSQPNQSDYNIYISVLVEFYSH